MLKRIILAISNKIDEKHSVPNEVPSNCNSYEKHPNSYSGPPAPYFISDNYVKRYKRYEGGQVYS